MRIESIAHNTKMRIESIAHNTKLSFVFYLYPLLSNIFQTEQPALPALVFVNETSKNNSFEHANTEDATI